MEEKNKIFKLYTAGFLLSLILTIAAYTAVDMDINSNHLELGHKSLTMLVLGLAFIQAAVQLIFFLHLGKEPGPRWNLAAFMSTAGIILIVVAGSIWIMYHLNYNMMPNGDRMDRFILNQENIKK